MEFHLKYKSMADYRKLKPFILAREGGYVYDPADSGKQTMRGVTIATFRSVYGQNKTVNDLKNITDEQWTYIFKKYFWDRWRADEIEDQSVANILVDWVWASGAYGIKIPQSMLRVTIDGIVGTKTIAAVNAKDGKTFFAEIKKERIAFIDRICNSRPQNKKFKKGWLNRINSLKYGG